MSWNINRHLNADALERWLAETEKQIRAASPVDPPDLETLPDLLREHWGQWFSLKGEARQQAFDRVRAWVIEEEIEAVRRTRDSATCTGCQAPFAFYWQTSARAERLRQKPALCLKCHRKAEEDKAREKRMDEFREANPLSRHYLHQKGSPPRPAQYAAVMNWREWSDDGDRLSQGLVLVGDSFTGKTTAVYHLFRKLIESGHAYPAVIVNAGQLNTIPERVMDRTIGEFMEQLQTAELLLIDDLDKVRITPRVASELWNLFEVRLRGHESPVFITLNTRTQRDFIRLFSGREADSRKVGESIYNRLRQACQFIDFDVTGA